MTKAQYIKLLTQAKLKTTDDFFAWLELFPDMMSLTTTEIEINFIMHSVAFDAYCLASFDYSENEVLDNCVCAEINSRNCPVHQNVNNSEN